MARKEVNIKIKLDGKAEFKAELDKLIKESGANNLKFDTSSAIKSLNEFTKVLDDVGKKIQGSFNSSQINSEIQAINKATEAQKKYNSTKSNNPKTESVTNVFKDYGDGNGKQQIATVTQLNNGLGQTVKITQDLINNTEKISDTTNFKSIDNINSKLQNGVNKLKSNDFLDESVIKDVQNRLNSINTNSSEAEVKQLEQEIKNLGSSDSQIVRVQNNLSKMKSGLESMQGKYKGLVGDKDSIAQLEKYNSEVKKLENLLSELQSGKTFTGEKISSELNQASEASRNLSNAVKNSSSALRLSQQDAQSFGNSIKKAFANAGMYTSVYEVIQLTSRALRDGIQTVIEMDSAIADLNKVVSMSKTQLDEMKDSAVSMGEAYAKSAIEVANAQAEAGRMYKDSATINKITEASLIGSNVMDNTTSAEVAKSLATVMTAMKMDVSGTMTILDSMNAVQNSYKISADSMIGALNEVASTAYTSGVSLQKAEGYITAIGVATGKENSEVGNSVRSLLAKIYKPKAQDTLEEEAKISVKDEMGEYKKAGDVLDELDKKWGTLTYTQQVNVAQSVGGIQRYNDFMSLMNNYQMSLDATSTAENSNGSAMKENAIYMETAEAKLQQLKTTMQEFALNTINSDMVKGGIDGLKGLVEVFGNIPMVVGLATTAFLMFKGKALLGAVTAMVDVEMTMGASSVATALFTGTVNSASASLKGLGLAVASNPLGLLAIAVTTVIYSISQLNNDLESTESLISGLDKSLSSLNDVKSQNKLVSQYEDLEKQIKSGNLSIEQEKKAKQDLLGVQKQLGSTFGDLVTKYDKEGNALATNIDKIKEKIKMNEKLAKSEAESSYNSLVNNIGVSKNNNAWGTTLETALGIGGVVDANIKRSVASALNGATSDIEDYQKLLSKMNNNEILTSEDQKKYSEIRTEFDGINSAVVKLKEAGLDISGKKIFDFETGELVDAKKYYDDLTRGENDTENATKGLTDANGNLIPSLSDVGDEADSTTSSIKEMADAFTKSTDKISLLKDVMKEFQDNNGTISADTMSKVFSSGDNETIALLGDKNTLLEKGQSIVDRETASQTKNRDAIIQSSIAETEATNNKAKQYGTDVDNKTSAENAKSKTSVDSANNVLGANTSLTTGLGSMYNKDVTNKINAENSKGRAVSTVNNGVLASNANTVNQLGSIYKTDSENFRKSQLDKMKVIFDPTKSIMDRINAREDFNNAIKNKTIFDTNDISIPSSSYNPVSANYNPVGIGTIDSNSGKGGSGSSSTKKEVDDLKDLRDRYYEVNNAIAELTAKQTYLKTISTNASGKEKADAMQKEIDLYKQQAQAISNKATAIRNERWELQRDLGNSGFTFGGQGEVTNYQSRLKALTDYANSLTSDAKENQIKAVEEVSEKLKNYTDLTINQTNDMSNQWHELSNSIRESYKAMADMIITQEKNTSDVITYYAEKNTKTKTDAIDRQMEAVNKMYDTEDKESDLSKKKTELAELKSEMDKFQFATDKIGINKFKALQEQYKTLEEDMNNTIRDTQKQATLDDMAKQKDDLSKSLEEYLKPENINKIIEAGMKTGMIDIMGSVIDLQNANAQMLKETEIGYTNIASKTKEWKDYLSSVIALTPQLNNITSNLGYNIDRTSPINLGTGSLNVANLTNSVGSGGINISMPVTFNGNVDDTNLSKVQDMLNTAVTNMKKEINNSLGNR